MSEPRQIDRLLERYSESHRHPTNELIHFVCVPAIVFSLLGLIWHLNPMGAVGATFLALAYYVTLSIPFAIGMLAMSAAMLAVLAALQPPLILPASLAIFVVAWIGQFIGHKIEGKKPSFFQDLRFLLIGPLFVLGFAYRRFKVAY